MRGAEVALVADTRLKVGSSAECDIVICDASLAPTAFELEVSESAVTLITPDGTQTQMKPLEIRDFGTTAVAVGPADEPWGELVRPAPSVEAAPAPANVAEEPSQTAAADAEQPEKKKSSHGCLVAILFLAFVLLLAVLAWVFWPRLEERWPQLAGSKARVIEFWKEKTERAPVCETPTAPNVTLGELASQYGLRLEKDGEADVLVGNLRRRTERLAIRALALAADPRCRIRLTDDETMLKASNELLFAYTDGALRATAASNCVVTLAGYAPDPAALERALRTLDADVKGIERVDALGVKVGGQAPVQRRPDKVAFCGQPVPETKPTAEAPKVPRRDYPIAGILTAPYPCVVLRDGHRVMEGAVIGTAELVRIESDRLVMKDGGTEFEWRP